MVDWADIEYREFWDVPRIFFLTVDNRKLLAYCPFDEVTEDSSNDYVVHEMPAGFEIPVGSWVGIENTALKELGKIAVEEVEFDETKRNAVETGVFRPFL